MIISFKDKETKKIWKQQYLQTITWKYSEDWA